MARVGLEALREEASFDLEDLRAKAREHSAQLSALMVTYPSTHGVFRMVMQVDGEVVRDVIPYIGYLHRGGEKLCETMDYRQGIGFMDRTEYLAAFNAELSYVMAV